MKPTNARSAALACLGEVLDEQKSLAEVTALDQLQDPRDRSQALRLSYGVLRWKSALEWLAAQLLKRPLKRSERAVQQLILLGIYQLWKEETAAHAAVHETAETARKLGKPWAVGLVNAVLRRFQREQDSLLEGLAAQQARFAHPDWLLRELRRDWPEDWETIAQANNTQAPLWLRVNRSRGTLAAARKSLEEADFSVQEHPFAPDALAIEPAALVSAIPGFREGRFSVQDPAAQLAARLMSLKPGQRVLDACAAPGGKTGHLLELEPTIELTALDQSATRLKRVAENLERLQLDARLLAADAGNPDSWWDGERFHRILLDAPCSATGVIRRHPEIKWLRTPQQVAGAMAAQRSLLEALWPLLEPGGILVYATCSVLSCENNAQVHAFLESHSDARCTGPEAPGRPQQAGIQILPGESGMDGFYYAVLEKTAG